MKVKLHDVPARCFQGVVPAAIATCDPSGIPNITHLSHVQLLEGERVALSCQFFNKTKKNVLENPHASVELYDPLTFDAYRLDIRFDHAETEGALFDSMRLRIDSLASQFGMVGVFRLLSADVYAVDHVEKLDGFLVPDARTDQVADVPNAQNERVGLQKVSRTIARAKDLDDLFNRTLVALEEAMGFESSMILLPDESGERLYAIAARGYGEAGIGAEVGFGEGLIGTVARERCILRVAGVGAELRYGRAIRTSIQRAGGSRRLMPEIPLPGLIDAQSQMALPLVAGDRLVGVIAVESRKAAAFEAWHEAFLEIIANQIASAIDAKEEDAEKEAEAPIVVAPSNVPQPPCARTLRLKFFKSDDCIFSGDEYLVRNVPGRILWKVLKEREATGRTEFSNRELRLDAGLGLPAIRDNLESRLVLLRKRLQAKLPEIQLVPTSRGRFRLDVTCPLELAELP
jgi:hypothetical protein